MPQIGVCMHMDALVLKRSGCLQKEEESSAASELEKVRVQNSMLQKLARTLQQEVKALKSMSNHAATDETSVLSETAEVPQCQQ